MISKPTLLLDVAKCKANIAFMTERANQFGLTLRPHFKTHQSLEIGSWFKDHGITKITVSSLSMASYFAEEWDDITVAFPVNILEIDTINKLAGRIKLNLLVESMASAKFLDLQLQHSVNFYIKINIGNNRAGLAPNDIHTINALLDLEKQSTSLNFIGFLGHAGQTYKCRSEAEIIEVHQQATQLLRSLKQQYQTEYPHAIASYGDTPSCSVAENFDGIDEIRPGNFVFYDLMQVQIGACQYAQIAVAMACPIVAIHKELNEIVVYGGGIHFSKDRIQENGQTLFGKVVRKLDDGWDNPIDGMYLKSISQEHGVVSVPTNEIASLKIGDLLYILPVHSCMTADLMKQYQTTAGEHIHMLKY